MFSDDSLLFGHYFNSSKVYSVFLVMSSCVFVKLLRRQQNLYGVFYFIMNTYLCNFDPLKIHFYIVKLGFTGVYIIFLISAKKHRLWVLVRTASARQFLRVPTIYVLSRNMKNIRIFI